jgi:hypothetical protein
MSRDPGKLPLDVWVRHCATEIMHLDPSLRRMEAEALAGSYWRERKPGPRGESPESVAERMLAPPACPLKWLE